MDLKESFEALHLDEELDDPNPFLIEPVLMVLMKNMSLSDLKNSRLVSSLWDQKAVDCLELRSAQTKDDKLEPLRIDQYFDNVSRLYKEVENRHILPGFDLDFDFYQKILLISPQMNILENFKVVNLTLNSINLKVVDWSVILHNLEKVHKSVRKLRITSVKRGSNFKKVEEQTQTSCQVNVNDGQMDMVPGFKLLQLNEFLFDSFYIGGRLFDDSSFKFLVSIMDLSPKLEIVRMDSFPISQGVYQMLIQSAFIKITKLEIRDWFLIPHGMNTYDFGSLHLKELIVQNIYTRNCDDIILLNNFLESQACTLESLYININFNSTSTTSPSPVQIKFPVCHNLKKLTINWSTLNWEQVPLEPINLSHLFPSVSYLHTNQMGNKNMWSGVSDTVKYLKVETITEIMENWENYVDIEHLFPNLQVIDTPTILTFCNPNPSSLSIKKLILHLCCMEDINIVNRRLEYLKELEVLDIGVNGYLNQNDDNFEEFFSSLESWIVTYLKRLKAIDLKIITGPIPMQYSEAHKRILNDNIEKFGKEMSVSINYRYTKYWYS